VAWRGSANADKISALCFCPGIVLATSVGEWDTQHADACISSVLCGVQSTPQHTAASCLKLFDPLMQHVCAARRATRAHLVLPGDGVGKLPTLDLPVL
jgi:hypothetical protein